MTDPPATQMVVAPLSTVDSTKGWWTGIGVLSAVAVAVTIVIWLVTDDPANAGFVDGAAVLAFVTGIAVGVERVVEVAWTRVDRSQTKGAWWPLSVVTESLKGVEIEMNTVLTPFLDNVGGLLTDLEKWTGSAEEMNTAVLEVTVKIQERANVAKAAIAHAQNLAPGSSRFVAIARIADDFTHDAALIAREANVWSRDLERRLREAGDLLSSTQDVVGAFKDNPARKTMSIFIGIPLGILASGILGLNMFSAVLGKDTPGYMVGVIGVFATGVVVGLGSNPTHEVIRALQRRKGDATVGVAVGSTVIAATTDVQQDIRVQRSAVDVDAVADIDGLDSSTVHRLFDVQQFMEQPAPQAVTRTTYISNRRVRPIRNTG